MDQVETVVVGAGVVGLAIARALAMAGREVVILERDSQIGSGVSSRNSEVIHAGLYYAPGSMKARLCVEGRHLLYDYCATRGIGHRRCEKLIVATDAAQVAGLEAIAVRAQAAGVDNLQWLERAEALALEPALHCVRALRSPSTGIVDSHGLMLALLGEAEDHGAMLARLGRLERVTCVSGGFRLEVDTEGSRQLLGCRELINAAGLGAVSVARSIEGLAPSHVPPAYLAKGSYFALTGRTPFTRLIYPIPSEAGLGVHLTLDLAGQGKFGPDVEWIDEEDYAVDAARADGFYEEIRRYWPMLPDGALQPAYAGIRPKIVGPEGAAADFRIDGPAVHGVPGLVNLFGIESPGLTSSLALAQRVRGLLVESGA